MTYSVPIVPNYLVLVKQNELLPWINSGSAHAKSIKKIPQYSVMILIRTLTTFTIIIKLIQVDTLIDCISDI